MNTMNTMKTTIFPKVDLDAESHEIIASMFKETATEPTFSPDLNKKLEPKVDLDAEWRHEIIASMFA